MSPAGTKRTSQSSYVVAVSSSMCHALLDVPACYADTASHASTRRQARTDAGGGEKERSVPELCSLESVCGQACVYRHIARCVFTTIFINHKYSCSGVFNLILTMLLSLFYIIFLRVLCRAEIVNFPPCHECCYLIIIIFTLYKF